MPYVETSTYCRTAGNLQFRGHVIHGIRIVSMREHILDFEKHISLHSVLTYIDKR